MVGSANNPRDLMSQSFIVLDSHNLGAPVTFGAAFLVLDRLANSRFRQPAVFTKPPFILIPPPLPHGVHLRSLGRGQGVARFRVNERATFTCRVLRKDGRGKIVVVDGNVPTKMMSNDWTRTNVLDDDAFPYYNCLFLSSASNPSYYEIDLVHPPHRADDYDDGVVADANYRRRLRIASTTYFFPLT